MDKKEFWNSARVDGLIFGGVLVAVVLISWLFRLDIDYKSISGLLSFVAIGACIYHFAYKRSQFMGDKGFSFAQCMGYILAVAMFGGFIFGVGQFVIWNYIATDYYQEILGEVISLQNVELEQMEMAEEAVDLVRSFAQNPIIMVLAAMFNILLYSCFVGIIVSIFVKKFPKEIENNEQE